MNERATLSPVVESPLVTASGGDNLAVAGNSQTRESDGDSAVSGLISAMTAEGLQDSTVVSPPAPTKPKDASGLVLQRTVAPPKIVWESTKYSPVSPKNTSFIPEIRTTISRAAQPGPQGVNQTRPDLTMVPAPSSKQSLENGHFKVSAALQEGSQREGFPVKPLERRRTMQR